VGKKGYEGGDATKKTEDVSRGEIEKCPFEHASGRKSGGEELKNSSGKGRGGQAPGQTRKRKEGCE